MKWLVKLLVGNIHIKRREYDMWKVLSKKTTDGYFILNLYNDSNVCKIQIKKKFCNKEKIIG